MTATQSMDPGARALLEESLARFSRDRYDRAAWLDFGLQPDGFSATIWSELAAMGWLGLGLPEDVGGTGEALADLVPLFVAAGRGLWREPLLPCLGEACGALLAAPPSGLRTRLLAGTAEGSIRLAYAHRESEGPGAPGRMATVASRHGAEFSIHGRKEVVLAAASCTGLLVSADLDGRATPGLFWVERQADGVCLSPLRTVDSRMAADVIFNAAQAELVASGSDWPAVVDRRAAILASAEASGVMQAANTATALHLGGRRQFGQPLARCQALRHRFAEMHMLELEALALVRAVAVAYDRGVPDLERRVWQLQLQVMQAVRHVTREGIQLHGAMGFTEQLPMGDYYKRALLLDSLHGSAECALDRLADPAARAGAPPKRDEPVPSLRD